MVVNIVMFTVHKSFLYFYFNYFLNLQFNDMYLHFAINVHNKVNHQISHQHIKG